MGARRMVLAALVACVSSAWLAGAAEELPPLWLAVWVGEEQVEPGPQARPPKAEEIPNPLAVVAPGAKVWLHCKLLGGRRFYMMYPQVYATIGPSTTITAQGPDRMSFSVDTGTFRGSGEWTVTEEKYTWDSGGRGELVVSERYATGELVAWTAPAVEGYYPITAAGSIKFKYVREGPGGRTESADNGSATMTFNVEVKAGAAGTAEAATGTQTPSVTPTPPAAAAETAATGAPTGQAADTATPAAPAEQPSPTPTTPPPTAGGGTGNPPAATGETAVTPPAPAAETTAATPQGAEGAGAAQTATSAGAGSAPAEGGSDAPVITSPLPGATVPPRTDVYGTGPAGAVIVVYTEVHKVADDTLLKRVPGLRHAIGVDGRWHVAVAIPELPQSVAEPLYYVIKAYWMTPGHTSAEASVRVQREQ